MTEQTRQLEDKHQEIKIIREVNREAEEAYGQAVAIGDHAAYALKRGHRSQLTGLENIAESSLKTSDIFDYIKRQTARFDDWRKIFPHHSDKPFGERLRAYLEQDLVTRRDAVSGRLKIGNATDEEKQLRRRIYLLLIQQFIRQMVVEYEYRASFEKDTNKKGE